MGSGFGTEVRIGFWDEGRCQVIGSGSSFRMGSDFRSRLGFEVSFCNGLGLGFETCVGSQSSFKVRVEFRDRGRLRHPS